MAMEGSALRVTGYFYKRAQVHETTCDLLVWITSSLLLPVTEHGIPLSLANKTFILGPALS
jgi:hypothetical protein